MPFSRYADTTICCDNSCDVQPGFHQFCFDLLDDGSYVYGDANDFAYLEVVPSSFDCALICGEGAGVLTTAGATDFEDFAAKVQGELQRLADDVGSGSALTRKSIAGGYRYCLLAHVESWRLLFGFDICDGLKVCACNYGADAPPFNPPCPEGQARFTVNFTQAPQSAPAVLDNIFLFAGEPAQQCISLNGVGDTSLTSGATPAELAQGLYAYMNSLAGFIAYIDGTEVTIITPGVDAACCGETPTLTYSGAGGGFYQGFTVSPLECCPTGLSGDCLCPCGHLEGRFIVPQGNYGFGSITKIEVGCAFSPPTLNALSVPALAIGADEEDLAAAIAAAVASADYQAQWPGATAAATGAEVRVCIPFSVLPTQTITCCPPTGSRGETDVEFAFPGNPEFWIGESAGQVGVAKCCGDPADYTGDEEPPDATCPDTYSYNSFDFDTPDINTLLGTYGTVKLYEFYDAGRNDFGPPVNTFVFFDPYGDCLSPQHLSVDRRSKP